MTRIRQFLIVCLCWFPFAVPSYSQGLRSSFYIPSKIQIADWEMLVSEHFIIYYQKEFIELARQTLEIGNKVTPPIENIIGFRLSKRLSIVLYPSPLDLNQSPFFLNELIPIQQNTGGTTDIADNSFAICFSGSHSALVTQIKKGIAYNLIQEMLFGGTVHERIKYATMMQIPDWFSTGLCNYIVQPWDANDDDAVRDIILRKGFFKISDLTPEERSLIGKSIWSYIAEIKGEISFQRILYLVRLTRKIESAFYFVFNWNTNQLVNEWHDYTIGIYLKDQQRNQPRSPEKRISEDEKLLDICFLDSTKFVQTVRKKNSFAIKVFDQTSELSEVWFNSKFKPLEDHDNIYRPLCTRDRSGGLWVADITPKGYVLYHLISKEVSQTIYLKDVSFLVDLDYDPIDQKFILSVVSKGKSELWMLFTSGKIDILHSGNSGFWDLKFDLRGQSFLCTGDQPFDSCKSCENKQIWGSDIYEWKPKNVRWELKRITSTPIIFEHKPVYYLTDKISFLSDENGINNAYSFDLATSEKVVLTDYKRNISHSEYDPNSKQILEIIVVNGRPDWYISSGAEPTSFFELGKSVSPTYNRIRFLEISKVIVDQTDSVDSDLKDSLHQKAFFQTDFPVEVDFVQQLPDTFSFENKSSIISPFQIKYVPTFKPDRLILQLDNGWVNTPYIPAMMRLKDAVLVPIGLNFSLRLRELLGNYSLCFGTRISRNFNHYDFFVTGRGNIGRFPVSTNMYRQSRLVFPSDGYHKIVTNSAAFSVYVWHTRFMALQIKGELRSDKRTILTTELATLKQENLYRFWACPSVNITYNNTREFGLNTFKGIKANAFVQYWQNTTQRGSSVIIGADVRQGIKLGTNLFWMNRLQFETSAGSMKTLYLAGGMENWLYPFLDEKTVIRDNAAFIRMATSIRGFNFNVRSGNTFAIINSEIRWRVLSEILKVNSRSEFLNNFMIAGFFDLGSAWYGSSPFDISNPNNVQIVKSGPMVITVYNHKQPIVLGLGYGLRASIFDYYIKFDQAIGLDNGKWQKMINYLTVGLDF